MTALRIQLGSAWELLSTLWRDLTRPASADFAVETRDAHRDTARDSTADDEDDRLGPDRHFTEYYLSQHP